MAILDAQKERKCLQELVCDSVDLIQLAHNSSWRKYCVRGYEIWGLTKQEVIVAIYFSHGLYWASVFRNTVSDIHMYVFRLYLHV
jgi:hypothetical protein